MQVVQIPGGDQEAAAALHDRLESARRLRRAFRLALARTGRAEPRAPIAEAERRARRKATRRQKAARRAGR